MNRSFKGVWIPAWMWLHPDLTPGQKLMLAEIDSLDDEGRGCFASNDYFAKFFKVAPLTISNLISHLKAGGFLSIKMDGRTRRILVIPKEVQVHEKYEAGSRNTNTEVHEKCEVAKASHIYGRTNGITKKKDKGAKALPAIEFPEHLNNEEFRAVWEAFVEARRKLRKPMTAHAQKLNLAKVVPHTLEIATAMVNQAIERGWSGIFDLKNERPQSNPRNPSPVSNSFGLNDPAAYK